MTVKPVRKVLLLWLAAAVVAPLLYSATSCVIMHLLLICA